MIETKTSLKSRLGIASMMAFASGAMAAAGRVLGGRQIQQMGPIQPTAGEYKRAGNGLSYAHTKRVAKKKKNQRRNRLAHRG